MIFKRKNKINYSESNIIMQKYLSLSNEEKLEFEKLEEKIKDTLNEIQNINIDTILGEIVR